MKHSILFSIAAAFLISLASADDKAKSADISAQLEKTKIGKQVAGTKLHRVDGEQFKEVAMEKAPEYYLIYFSASY